MSEIILGISAYYHDSAAVLLCDGKIIAAAQEERFSRVKHDASFPSRAVSYVLDENRSDPEDVSAVIFYDKPYIKFERLLETYHNNAPLGFKSFLASMPVWIKEKLFLKKILKTELAGIGRFACPVYFSEHHLSHAASAFFPSPFMDAAILTVDGVGEWVTTAIAHGKDKDITMLRELHFPHSLGLFYSSFTAYCGFRVNSGEYKLMGLAPYGNRNSCNVNLYIEKIESSLINVQNNGSFKLNMSFFDFATGLRMYNLKKWNELFGFPPRVLDDNAISQNYIDLALACQIVAERILLKLARTARELTGSENCVLAGGVALNCVANGILSRSGIFKNYWVQPAAGDAGGALGAALAYHHISKRGARVVDGQSDSMQGALLGPAFGQKELERLTWKYGAIYEKAIDQELFYNRVAGLIADGAVIGWFQGRMEFGPRALGNRSILADPRIPDIQKRLNLKTKFREGFRPFAPAVLLEDLQEIFEMDYSSPYMLFTCEIKEKYRKELPHNYDTFQLWEKLYYIRSQFPSVTHVDFSARVQTVQENINREFWKLLKKFKEKSGFGILINTSFNVRGEPIVCTPDDAYRCFMITDMDYLVINNCIFDKKFQPSHAFHLQVQKD